MRLLSFSSIIFFLMAFTSCSLFINIGEIEAEAEAAYEDGRNEEALELYESLIEAQASRDDDVDGKSYERAGILAYRLGKNQRAIDYLEKARQAEGNGAEGLIILANIYQQIDNLSLEIRTLKHYLDNHPSGSDIGAIRKRYFETLVQSENWQRAYEFWPELEGEPYKDKDLLEGYFKVNKELGNDDLAGDLAEKLFEKDENNKLALDWMAKNFYYKGIDLYNYEMEAYQNNRTHSQYAQLREAWPVIYQHLRTSRDYFLRLYNMEPKKEYARFLANIYERLDNDEKARYYREKVD